MRCAAEQASLGGSIRSIRKRVAVKKICAWCTKELSPVCADGDAGGPITHGICDDCAALLNSDPRKSAGNYLEGLKDAVFLVGAGGRIVSANSAARTMVGKELTAIEDRLSGDVFECVNAELPGGCGKTKHCKACAIRKAMEGTLADGTGVEGVPAVQNIRTPDGVRERRYLISTEKIGDSVLLRIDNVA